MGHRIKRWGILILAVLFMIHIFIPSAFADDGISLTESASLAIRFCPEGEAVAEGVTFSLYRIADMDNTGGYTLLEKYAAYDIDTDLDSGSTDRKTLADTLSAYIAADGIGPDEMAVTNYEGIAAFKDLSAGLYLVMGEEFDSGRKIYTPETFIIFLPATDENGIWVYDVSVNVKYESRPGSESIDLKVIKIWDDGEGNNRPESITVELYDGGILLDTVILDSTNDWSYCWEELYGGASYSVIEKNVPEGYTVSVEKDANTFIITNHRPDEPAEPELPYTGVLWWPVALLTFAGVVLMLLGYIENRRNIIEK
ncbi:MAG: Cna B-type domain-containing protein [Anaerofustis stercorihominis]|nr:Cna B-type domain-containing protein [Anaerofustis stercorihominis]